MNATFNNLFLRAAVTAALGAILASQTAAQTFKALHSFSGPYMEPRDGAGPFGGLTLSGDTLYGTTGWGGSGGGTIFTIKTDGTGLTNLFNFPSTGGQSNPLAGGLTVASNTLYGTTYFGGPFDNGTVFRFNSDSSDFTTLYTFPACGTVEQAASNNCMNTDGGGPMGGLALAGNTLYGTTSFGGPADFGTVFKVNTDGTGFRTLHSFDGGGYASGSLALSEGALYGVTGVGGEGAGSVFKINTDGSDFALLYSFSGTGGSVSGPLVLGGGGVGFTNRDGYFPRGGLALSGGTLYGATMYGGNLGNGLVFKINTNGTDFTILHAFTAYSGYIPFPDSVYFLGTNSDGARPMGGLKLSGDTLLGTTEYGGNAGNGTVFKVNTDGTGFEVVHSFSTFSAYVPSICLCPDFGINSDGAKPVGFLTLCGNTVYGTAWSGGSSGLGTIFGFSFSPSLAVTRSESSIILSWPTSYAGFDYTGFAAESTTNLTLPAWSSVSSVPIVQNGRNTVTNPLSGTQQFFRLSQRHSNGNE